VGDAGQNQLLDVAQNRIEGLPWAGALGGSDARIEPGFTCDSTGNDSIRL